MTLLILYRNALLATNPVWPADFHIAIALLTSHSEIIADSIETVTCAQHHDACIAIPGCDKNSKRVPCTNCM